MKIVDQIVQNTPGLTKDTFYIMLSHVVAGVSHQANPRGYQAIASLSIGMLVETIEQVNSE